MRKRRGLTPEEAEIFNELARLRQQAYREYELLADRNKRSRAHAEAMLRRIGLEAFGHDYMRPAERWRRAKRGW